MPILCILDSRGLAFVFFSRWAWRNALTASRACGNAFYTDCAQAAISEQSQMAALLLGLETTLYLSSRLQVYMGRWLALPTTPARVNFESCLVEFHALILQFLAGAMRIYQKGSIARGFEAFWRIEDMSSFEDKCHKMASRAEIEASNCDRDLSAVDRAASKKQQENLQEVLKQLEAIHLVQTSIDKLEAKLDLSNLPLAAGAVFNSYEDELDARCHPDTRVDLLRDICKWAEDVDGECIFWLNGMAGTGKSTISRTVAQTFADCGQLGASFFFKRGEHDRENARLFFPTIVHELLRQIPALRSHIQKAIDNDPAIASRALKEQFDKLIFQPLIEASSTQSQRSILVIDALDECHRDHVSIILSLLRRLSQTYIRVFLTSRPELPIRLGFGQMRAETHRDVLLHDVPPSTIRHDVLVYLKDEFTRIRDNHQYLLPPDQSLPPDWPGAQALRTLSQLAVPLFIVAATICRFVGELNGNPLKRLARILDQPIGQRSQLERTYLPVLSQILVGAEDVEEKEKLCHDFRAIVGSIVLLADPLSSVFLAKLLDIEKSVVDDQLRCLHSVLSVSSNANAPIRLLHLSFREFLMKKSHSDLGRQFTIDESTSHGYLADKCLALLQSSEGLRKDICQLKRPGVLRSEIDNATIESCIPQHLRYACRYWVYHIRDSGRKISDGDEAVHFLRQRFFHWLECLSLLNNVSEGIGLINILQSIAQEANSQTSILLQDARRFLLTFSPLLAQAPLQVYGSAWHFSPLKSIIRHTFQKQRQQNFQVASGLPEQWSACLQTYEGHSNSVNRVVFSPDGSRVASGSADNTVRVWDVLTGECQYTLEGHSDTVNSVIFSPDGLRVASGSDDNTVRVWNILTGECQYTLESHFSRVRNVVFSPDGLRVASAVKVWDVLTGEYQHTLESHSFWFQSVVFSPDGSRVASGSDDTVQVWDVLTGECQYTLEGHFDSVNNVIFSPDGSRVASGSDDNTVRVWDVLTGECQHTLEGHFDSVWSVVFSPDGSRVVSGSSDNTVRIWDMLTGECQHTLEGHFSWIRSVVFSPDGSRVASGSDDNTVRIWDVLTGECQHTLEGHFDSVHSVIFSPNGSRVASGSGDKTVRVWDVLTGKYQHTFKSHSNSVNSVVFSPDGSRVASGSDDNTVRVWDVLTGECQYTLEGHSNTVDSVIFSPDGLRVASGSGDNTVRVWDVLTGECQYTLEGHSDTVNSVVFSPDGLRVASGSDDNTIRVWNILTGECQYTLESHSDTVNSVVFSPDGSQVASSSVDKTVRVWNVQTGECQRTFESHSHWVRSVVFSPNGSRVASSSDDNTVRVWDIANSMELLCYDAHIYNHSIEFSNDSTKVLINGELVQIPSRMLLSGTAAKLSKPNLNSCGSLEIIDEWVMWGSERILWLPPECRPDSWAIHNDIIVIGSGNGRVTFLRRVTESSFQ
jgi:WD40 repeat protein